MKMEIFKDKNKVKKLLVLIAIYFTLLGIRIYWLSQKEGFHVDEGLTVTLACYNDYMSVKNYSYNIEFTGKEIKEMSLCSDDSIKNAFADIKSLWKDNRDPPHTNLYYSFLRLSLAGLKTGEIKPIIFRGGLLNLVFFTISFIFFFLIMRLLFADSPVLQFISTSCAFLSTAAISNTLFLRPYQLQETVFVIFCYYLVKTLDSQNNLMQNGINKKEVFIKIKQFVILSILTGVTLLTGYYAIIFIALFGIYIIINKIKAKKYSDIFLFIIILFFGILIAQVLYPKYLQGFYSYRATETSYTLFANVFNNIKLSFVLLLKLINIHFYTFPVIALTIFSLMFIIYKKEKIIFENHALALYFLSLLYMIIIMILAPYKILRYIMPLYPFLIILPSLIFYNLYKRNKIISYIVMLMLCVMFIAGSFNRNKIEHLYSNKAEQYKFAQNKEIPVVILNYSLWKYPNLIPYLNDEQTYYFIKDHNEINSLPYSEYYLVIENIYELRQAVYSKKYNITEEFEMYGLEPETFVHNLDKYFYGMKLKVEN